MSSPEDVGLPSPLTLLLQRVAEERAAAEEVLLLSYTLDLGFFERAALGPAHALGARVSVVGDAVVVRHDPRAVRRAGRSYLPGLAACRGAFHPKLAVIVGAEEATVAIGSGNTTMAGWGDNHELWSVLHADESSAPATLGAVATWLRQLDGPVRLSAHVGDALRRTATHLERFSPTVEGPLLVSSLSGSILDQLPEGPVDELAIYAPFHDRGAHALRALIERMQPSRLLLVVQPCLTVIDGPSVDALTADLGADVRETDTSRYRHGKLVEWSCAGERWALTGSPNCTSAALLRSVPNGGNCELGLVTRILETLLPAGDHLPRERLRAHSWVLRTEPRPSLVLLGATRVEAGVEIMLASEPPTRAWVEVSPPAAQPDSWERIAELPQAHSATITWAAEGGTRLRVAFTTATGDVAVSNVVFVVDPARALRSPTRSCDRVRTTEPFDLFRDVRLAEVFVADLGGLRTGIAPAARYGAGGSQAAGTSTATSWVDSYGTWESYLDDCAGRVGHALINFALGLPDLTAGSVWTDAVAAEWDEEIEDDDEAALEDDQADDVANEAEDIAQRRQRLPSLSDQPERVRRRYRSWAGKVADATDAFGPAERLIATRLLLWTIAAGAWPRDDNSWVRLLSNAARALGTDELPAQVEAQAGSLVAVLLSVLRAQAPRHKSTLEGRELAKATAASEHLLIAADEKYIAEYARLLDDAFGAAVHAKVVLDLVHEILEVDPLDVALLACVELGLEAHRHGPLLHVEGVHSNPQLAALQAVGMAEDQDPVGAWAQSASGWALVIWRRPDVLVAQSGGTRPIWHHFVLPSLLSPRVSAYVDGRLRPEHRRWASFPGQPLAPVVDELLASVGLSSPQPPDCGLA